MLGSIRELGPRSGNIAEASRERARDDVVRSNYQRAVMGHEGGYGGALGIGVAERV